MEPLDELMTKALRYIQAVNAKESLVTEGIRKLQNCENEIIKIRLQDRNDLHKILENVEIEQETVKSREFEKEQLAEQLRRLTEQEKREEKELQQMTAEINNKTRSFASTCAADLDDLNHQRQVLSQNIQNKIASFQSFPEHQQQ